MTGAWSTFLPASRSINIPPAVRAIATTGLTIVVNVGDVVAAGRTRQWRAGTVLLWATFAYQRALDFGVRI